jgi:aerobic-type carbon monoxide dehydrogenase small subunit (CoxS/CutS family)
MELIINNKKYVVDAPADESLLNVLRNDLDLTGSKYGCGEGACGACKVLVDGIATPSCTARISTLNGRKITTIEGISTEGKLSTLQRAFLEVDVFQCAYCASGMIVAATSLLNKNSHPTETEIVSAMQGNICRCGTHRRIVNAIVKASNA